MVSLLTKTFLICMLTTSLVNQAMQEAESDPTQELLDVINYGTKDDAERAMRAIARGANVNVQGESGDAPLHFAVAINHVPLAELLINMKADLEVKNDWQDEYSSTHGTPLDGAIRAVDVGSDDPVDRRDLVMLLLDSGAQVGDLLYVCAIFDKIPLMETLLDKKADVDAQATCGYTALHLAHDFEIVRLLLERGADWDLEDDDGETPLQSNRVFTNPRFLDLIQQRREEIQKQFLVPATVIIHATPVGQEEGIAKIIAEYAVPEVENCNIALKKSIDKFNQRV